MKKTLAVLVENRPGVLTHVSGLISRRGYNIASIAASPTEEPEITRISLVVEVADQDELEQIEAHLAKLITVVKVMDTNDTNYMARELALLKVWASQDARQDIISLADIFRARIIDIHPESIVIEITGESTKIDAFCELMNKHGIIEIIRTGEIFLSRKPVAAIKSDEGCFSY